MSANTHLNGSDYLMLGFDHELRRHGFAGNSCQIVLELGAAISPAALQKRLVILGERYPILRARPGGLIRPQWKLPSREASSPQVRIHRERPGLSQTLCNEPLATKRGELVRFDLVECESGRMNIVFTWAHALMDAPGAEHFLALVGREELPPVPWPSPSLVRARLNLIERFKLAWKNLNQIDQFGRTAPRSLGIRNGNAAAFLRYHVEKFSRHETARVRANALRLCGVLGMAQFHAAAALLELHQLHQRLGCHTPSYILPVPVGLRPKGAVEPLFSNQLAIIMTQFLPEHLGSMASAVTALKDQTLQALRTGLIESSRLLGDLFRFLPLPIYMSILKRGLGGEICSLFYGETAAVNPLLTFFLGVPVEDFIHVAAVTPSPGLGVIFYLFRDELRLTILHLAATLTEVEASEFGIKIRQRLLDS